MHVEFIVNKDVMLVLSPENVVEEESLKALMKQQNELTEVRTAVTILNKTLRNGIIIGKAASIPPKQQEENETQP